MDWNGSAAFSPDGKYLAFAHETDTGADVMLLELNPEKPTYDLELLFPDDVPAEDEEEAEAGEAAADESAEVEEAAEDEAAADETESAEEEGEAAATEEKEEVEPLTIDLNRIHLRAEPLTSFTGSAYSLAFDPNSEYLLFVTNHSGEDEWWTITLEDREPSRLDSAQTLSSPQFVPDGSRLYYQDGQRVGYFEMSGPNGTGGGGVSFTSRLDYDQYAIWEEVLKEGWRILDQSFYDPLMGGVDWDEVLQRYLPRVRECATVYEFGTLYREMLGELGRSHVGYWGYGDERELPADNTADFGVYWDEDYTGPGWKVARVIPDGPGTVPGAKLYAGDTVLDINGEPIAAGESREMRLNNLVGEPLKLTVQNGSEALAQLAAEAEAAQDEPAAEDGTAEDDGGADVSTDTREIVIKPTDQRAVDGLRYELWVEDNRAQVNEMSDGRIGYQHIERMYGDALEKFRRELFTESVNTDALIIDVRFNSGGHTAVDVMNILDERPAYLRSRRDDPVRKFGRQYVWQGPLVVLVNAYSFSNAEIFAHIMKDAGLATIIGEPTPGGVISTSSVQLLDGSWLGIPSGGNFRLTGEDMEGPGAGVQPDVVVLIDPEQLAQGHDNQLETAVRYLLEELGADGK
jgi:tricorn protease